MRINCPICGPRDQREFYYLGHKTYLHRPPEGAAPEAWDAYLHLRDNRAGVTRELWFHEMGCAAWIVVERNTLTHEMRASVLAADLAADLAGGTA